PAFRLPDSNSLKAGLHALFQGEMNEIPIEWNQGQLSLHEDALGDLHRVRRYCGLSSRSEKTIRDTIENARANSRGRYSGLAAMGRAES
ncbi:MAG: hypothetical protein ACREA2_01950, partial [Blastocatellia bacterium]